MKIFVIITNGMLVPGVRQVDNFTQNCVPTDQKTRKNLMHIVHRASGSRIVIE